MSSTAQPTDSQEPAMTPDVASGPTSAVQQRTQKLFERAKACLSKADYAYAHDLFSQCIADDPSSLVFAQHFRANLAQMHPNATATKQSSFAGLPGFGGGRGAVAKFASKGDWPEAFAAGCRVLKRSPGDTGVLAELASACGELGHTDCQLYYLRWALDLSSTDIDLNRQAAAALEAVSEFDQAIGCWVRVQQQRPHDEEASQAISRLSVEKTIDRGGYNPALLNGAAEVEGPQRSRVADASALVDGDDAHDGQALTPATPDKPNEDELRAAIEAAPGDPAPYAALADYFAAESRLQDAERLLRKALTIGDGNDLLILEKLEDVHLLRMRERARVAEDRAVRQGSAAAQKQAEQMLREANEAEATVFGARSERTPGDPKLQYEYGLRLKRIGKHREAISPFQAARDDSKKVAQAELMLGECFQHIDQHSLAMRSYEAAIGACPQGDWSDLRKLALYRAGVLAMGLKDLDRAEQHLADLASADFGYRDVAERLDKLARIRNTT